MQQLGNGLSAADQNEDALSVREAELSMYRRLGAPEDSILIVQGNLANSYQTLGRTEALDMYRDVYSGYLKFNGEEHEATLIAAINYANCLNELKRHKEARSVLRKKIPVARRVLGESHDVTLKMRCIYAMSLYSDPAATLDDLREAVATLEQTARIARRVLGGAHPVTVNIEKGLRLSRAALRARETPPRRA